MGCATRDWQPRYWDDRAQIRIHSWQRAKHKPWSLNTWQLQCSPGQRVPARKEALPSAGSWLCCQDRWPPACLSLPIPYSFSRQNSSNSSHSLDLRGTTFSKCSSNGVIFLKIKPRCRRKEVEERKTNSPPGSWHPYPGLPLPLGSCRRPSSIPTPCLHAFAAAGCPWRVGLWSLSLGQITGWLGHKFSCKGNFLEK